MVGCIPDNFLVLEGGITTLVFVDGTVTVGCPTIGLYLVVEISALTNQIT